MSAILESKALINRLAAEGQRVYADPALTNAAKIARMKQITAEMKSAGDTIDQFKRAGYFGLTAAVCASAPGYEPELRDGASTGGFKGRRVAPIELPEQVLKGLFGAATSKQRLSIDTKDIGTDLEGYIPATLAPTVQRRIEPTRVAGLLPVAPMETPVIEYPRILGQTGGAGVTPAAGLKPLVGLTTDVITARAIKLAGLLTVQDEALMDYPSFSQIISAELRSSLIMAENQQLLLGTGSANGQIDGLIPGAGLTRTALAASTGDTALDTIEQAMTDIRSGSAYAEPDSCVMHPADWSGLRRLKNQLGAYLLNNDPTADTAPSLFGMDVVLTTDIPVGTALVGAFALAAVLHVRLGMIVQTSNSGDTDFAHNTTTFRIETREAVAITRPAALCAVNLVPAA